MLQVDLQAYSTNHKKTSMPHYCILEFYIQRLDSSLNNHYLYNLLSYLFHESSLCISLHHKLLSHLCQKSSLCIFILYMSPYSHNYSIQLHMMFLCMLLSHLCHESSLCIQFLYMSPYSHHYSMQLYSHLLCMLRCNNHLCTKFGI